MKHTKLSIRYIFLLTIVGANLEIVGRTAIIEDGFIGSINQNIAKISCRDTRVKVQYLMIY